MLETQGLVAAIEAADAMLKAAEVRLVQQQRTVPALVTHFVVGDTAAVRSAVEAGAVAAGRVGRVVARHVIPRPDASVWGTLLPLGNATNRGARSLTKPEPFTETEAPAEYASMTVRELRSLARDREEGELEGRAISRAKKAELIAYLESTDA